MDSLDSTDSRPLGSSFLPVALALAGILLGAVSLYFGVTAQNKPSPTLDAMGMDDRLESLELRLEALSAENQALKNGLAKVAQQTQTALTQVGREISTIHHQHAESRETMGKLAGAVRPVEKKSPPAPVTVTSGASLVKTAPVQSNVQSKTSGFAYTIQPGDTLAKLARRYSLPLQTLLDANPNINPKALKVGQVVKVPAGAA